MEAVSQNEECSHVVDVYYASEELCFQCGNNIEKEREQSSKDDAWGMKSGGKNWLDSDDDDDGDTRLEIVSPSGPFHRSSSPLPLPPLPPPSPPVAAVAAVATTTTAAAAALSSPSSLPPPPPPPPSPPPSPSPAATEEVVNEDIIHGDSPIPPTSPPPPPPEEKAEEDDEEEEEIEILKQVISSPPSPPPPPPQEEEDEEEEEIKVLEEVINGTKVIACDPNDCEIEEIPYESPASPDPVEIPSSQPSKIPLNRRGGLSSTPSRTLQQPSEPRTPSPIRSPSPVTTVSRNKRARDENEDYVDVVPQPKKLDLRQRIFTTLAFSNNTKYPKLVENIPNYLDVSQNSMIPAFNAYDNIIKPLLEGLGQGDAVGQLCENYLDVGALATTGCDKKYTFSQYIDTAIITIDNIFCNEGLTPYQFNNNILIAKFLNIWLISNNGYVFIEQLENGNLKLGYVDNTGNKDCNNEIVNHNDMQTLYRVFVNDITLRGMTLNIFP